MTQGSKARKALVVGAGIGGLNAAIALKQAGLDVELFERRGDLGEIQIGGGIVLWANAVHALKELGLADPVIAAGIKVTRGEHRSRSGKVLARFPIKDIERAHGVPSLSISRSNLHHVLDEAIGDTPVHLNTECTGFEEDAAGGVTAQFADGSRVHGDLLVCADGRNSSLRNRLGQVGESYPPYAGYTLWSTVAHLEHPLVPLGGFIVMHGRAEQLYFFHLKPGEVYWSTAAWVPARARGREFDTGFKAELQQRLAGWGEPVQALLAASDENDFARRDIYGGTPLPRWGSGHVTLLGDAAHPMTTTQGQGACSAIEDAVVLGRCLRRNDDVGVALQEYEAQRKPRTDALMSVSKGLERSAATPRPVGCWIRDHMIGLVFSTPALTRRLGWYKEMTRVI